MYHGRFKGTHYQAGFTYGKMLKEHGTIIDKPLTFEITKEMQAFTLACMPLYQTYFPEVVEEIKGMADGQGSSFEVLCQILFSMYCFSPEHHCTSFALAGKDTILFGRNSDFLVSIEKLYMNCLYNLEGSHAFNGNTTAFIQMEDGINDHGLAIGLTFLYPHIQQPGLNAGMLVRYVLEKCTTTKEAIAALQKLPIASGQTLSIVDRSGEMVTIECNPKHFVIITPQEKESFVVSTNHFYSEELKDFNVPQEIDDWQAKERYDTVQQALQGNTAKYSLTYVQQILAGKYGFICQYDRKQNKDTVWSVVYDVKNSKIYRVEGNPSRKKFIEDTRMTFIKLT